MEEERGVLPENNCFGKKKHNCTINIFCSDKKHHGPDCGPDDNCDINIFCSDMYPEALGNNHGCAINIFCSDLPHPR